MDNKKPVYKVYETAFSDTQIANTSILNKKMHI